MSQAKYHSSYPPAKQHSGEKLTEIVLSHDHFNAIDAVLPMLAHLSHQDTAKWLTWIAPPAGINRTLLTAFGFNLEKIRLIHPSSKQDPGLVFWNALKQGNSATVVVSSGKLNQSELVECENAAIVGGSNGLVLRYR